MHIQLAAITAADARAAIDLFNHYVLHSFAAFPENPLPEAFFDRLLEATRGLPAVAARDPSGRLLGFALLRPHIPWPTSSHVAEITHFVAPDSTGLGTQISKGVEGVDLSHLARGHAGAEPEAALLMNTGACALWQDGHEWRALRDKRFTCAVFRGGSNNLPRKEVLFDNVADLLQMKNLAGEPAQASRRTRYRDMLAARRTQLNDTFPASSWYRDRWTDGNRRIIAGASGPFPTGR